MTDKYADLRAALDAGPKPGRWTWKQVGSFNTPGCAVFWPDTSKGGIHYRRLDSGGGMEQVDAGYIAAAHPETIRALLADYDRMRVALTTIKEWPITSPLNMDAYNMKVVAHAALAQEQGGSDAN